MSDDWSTAVFVGFWLLVLFVAFASPVIRRDGGRAVWQTGSEQHWQTKTHRSGGTMTPIDNEHAVFLMALAKNTNDKTTQMVYADWLQEKGNAGWIVVANYPVHLWPVPVDESKGRSAWGKLNRRSPIMCWRIPFLGGSVFVDVGATTDGRTIAKAVLRAYADGGAA